eukprot:TRINITY_DN1503_c0_g1_i1.p1 TRINITY_DN1503_c0_g1~~TRINITY_DN1503_c0_g1_i1.p1  ORF type:complete len:383 (+),score=133.25 TRINITY_DN1503_c0_g1_i1:648-1796(+)
MNKFLVFALVMFFGISMGKIFYEESFDSNWESRWVASQSRSDNGKLVLSDDGIKTSEDARFYQYTDSFDEFSNRDDTLVFQYESRHAQNLDCGGGYLKILPSGFDAKQFNGDTPYAIMFGPDICGGSKRTHFIINYKGKNHLIRSDIPAETDTFSHVYTLILKPDQTFRVLIDNVEKRAGNLIDDFDFLPPKQINDPAQSKPSDWVDSPKMVDPEDVKPEGWDSIPATIADPEAKKPEDWDDDLDGEWTAPTIDNPEYKGEWKARQIDNPAYKGPWVHPQIDNPEYQLDNSIYAFDKLSAVGIEIWQVKSGSTYDNILITNDESVAQERAAEILKKQQTQKDTKAKEDEEQRKKLEEERKQREQEEAAKKTEEPATDAKDEL